MNAKHRGRQEYREHHQDATQQEQDVSAEVEGLTRGQRRPDGHEHGGCALRGVKEPVVFGSVLAAEEISAKRRK